MTEIHSLLRRADARGEGALDIWCYFAVWHSYCDFTK